MLQAIVRIILLVIVAFLISAGYKKLGFTPKDNPVTNVLVNLLNIALLVLMVFLCWRICVAPSQVDVSYRFPGWSLTASA